MKDENSLMNFKNILTKNKVSILDYETPFFMKSSFGVKDPDNNLIIFGISEINKGIALSSTYSDHILSLIHI